MTQRDDTGARDALCEQLDEALGESCRIERELGGGGMSRVFVALDTRLGRRIVVKSLADEVAVGLSAERFQREILVAARLQEPHIVPVLGDGLTAGGTPFYTMPFVDGASLHDRMQAGPVPQALALSILTDVARALSYAHAQGIVHRDIKPANVLLSSGTAVVTDFGIAKAISAARADTAAALTRTGMGLGTPAYMAPEQAAGDVVSPATDLYAWGMIAYELLGGVHPFAEHTTPQRLMVAQLTQDPPPLEVAGAPAALTALVMACLAKEPGDRPKSADVLLQALDGARSLDPLAGEPLGGESRRGVPDARTRSADVSSPRTGVRARRAGVLAVSALVLFSAVLLLRPIVLDRSDSTSLLARGTLAQGDELLLAAFGSGTDSALAAVVTEALRVDLGSSRAFSLTAPSRIAELLRLMARPADTPLTSTVVRELAVRAGIAAVIEGDISAVGRGFLLIARLVDPETGREYASLRTDASSEAELIDAIGELSTGIRRAIGESLGALRSRPPLHEVTTSSLEALRRYTEGVQSEVAGDPTAAVRRMQEAIALDSGFAMAWRSLGTMSQSARVSNADRRLAHVRAFELRDRLTPLERALAEETYHDMVSLDADAEFAAHARILELQPRRVASLNNYARALAQHRGDYAQADSLLGRANALRPSFGSLSNLVWIRLLLGADVRADSAATEFERLYPDLFWGNRGRFIVSYHRGDATAALRAADALAEHPTAPERWRSRGTWYGALALTLAGRVGDARGRLEREVRRALDAGHPRLAAARQMDRAWLEATVFGDSARARTLVQELVRGEWATQGDDEAPRWFSMTRDAVRVGALAEATTLEAAWRASGTVTPGDAENFAVVAALRRAHEGDPAGAFTALSEIQRSGAPRFPPGEWPAAHHCVRCFTFDLAQLAELAGRADDAITLYARHLAERDDLVETPLTRLVASERMGALLAARGDSAAAREAYARVTAAWRDAEPPLRARAVAAALP